MVLSTGSFSRDIGTKPLLDAFFATVGCRLEPAGRATRFPAIMTDLFNGVLTPRRAPAALAELSEIEHDLRMLPADKVLGISGAPRGVSAYQCLVSPDGQPIIEHIRAAVEECSRSGKFLQVCISPGNRVQYQMALILTLFGIAWIVIARKFFGNWILVSISQDPEDHSGLYVWTLGFIFIATSGGYALTAKFPLLRVWSERHKWATLIVVLALVGVLIYFGMAPRPGGHI